VGEILVEGEKNVHGKMILIGWKFKDQLYPDWLDPIEMPKVPKIELFLNSGVSSFGSTEWTAVIGWPVWVLVTLA
jgi:hypothetical protein